VRTYYATKQETYFSVSNQEKNAEVSQETIADVRDSLRRLVALEGELDLIAVELAQNRQNVRRDERAILAAQTARTLSTKAKSEFDSAIEQITTALQQKKLKLVS
jgi:hypothetical protein